MKLTILHAFENRQQMAKHLSKIKTLGKLNKYSEDIKLGNLKILYRVIKHQEDFLKICGIELTQIEWHYQPDEEIEKYVHSRLRGMIYNE